METIQNLPQFKYYKQIFNCIFVFYFLSLWSKTNEQKHCCLLLQVQKNTKEGMGSLVAFLVFSSVSPEYDHEFYKN